jgi:hypothetical protein
VTEAWLTRCNTTRMRIRGPRIGQRAAEKIRATSVEIPIVALRRGS